MVGTQPWVGTEPLFLARERGLFAGPVHLAEYMNSAHAIRAFHNGVLDVVSLTLEEVLYLDHLGQEAQVVLVLDSSHGADCLVARPEVKTLGELKGKRVGSEDVLLPTYILHRALEQAQLGLQDVQRVYEGPAESERTLREGQTDAAVAYEPYCQRMVAAGGHVLFDSRRMPDEIVDVLVLRRRFLQAHPEKVDMLLRGWFAALAFMREHPSESARLMGPRVGLDEAGFLEALQGVRHPDMRQQRALLQGPSPRLHETIRQLGRVMVQQRLLPELPVPERLIDPAPLLRVEP